VSGARLPCGHGQLRRPFRTSVHPLRAGRGPDGVFLGRDADNRPAELQSWSTIDAVVHFEAWAPDDGTFRYIGVARGKEIVSFRIIDGWKLDKSKASRAVASFGGGRPFQSLPYRPEPVNTPPLRIMS
jgi:hypothetical protein